MAIAESRTDTFHNLRLEVAGPLRRIVLDRPPLNILDIETLRELDAAVGAVERDPEASVLVVMGDGKAFCAGVDVADHTEDRVHAMLDAFHRALLHLAHLELPVVAAVNGAALGGGMELMLACDIVLARAGAKLGQPEIQLGVLPPFASAVLPHRVGPSMALDLCLTGRTLEAEEGRLLGLVQHVYPRDSFAEDVRAFSEGLASLSRPVLRLTKRAVLEGDRAPLADALPTIERLYLDELMELEDAREGLAAFMEKRPPAWKGA